MYAILRSFNTRKVLDLIARLNEIEFISRFVVVINAKEDKINTPKLLAEFKPLKPTILVPIENYGWSKALNAGLCALPPATERNELVLMVSNEVHVTPQNILRLKQAASQPTASCGYSLFADRTSPTYYLPRNTYIVWKRAVFEAVGLFDERLDEGIGMEDYQMALRAFQHLQLLPFLGPQEVRIDARPGIEEKVGRELKGVEAIERDFPAELVRTVREHLNYQNRRQEKRYLIR